MGAMPCGPAAALARGLAVFPIPPGQRKARPGWQQFLNTFFDRLVKRHRS